MGFLDSQVSEPASVYNPRQYLIEKARKERLPNGLKPLKRLTARHMAILNLHIIGEKGQDIAKHFNVRGTLVSRIVHDPLGQAYILAHIRDHDARFETLYGEAVDVLKDGMSNTNHIKDRLRASGMVLERKDRLDDRRGGSTETAEDVVQRILALNLTVNVNGQPALPAGRVIEQEG